MILKETCPTLIVNMILRAILLFSYDFVFFSKSGINQWKLKKIIEIGNKIKIWERFLVLDDIFIYSRHLDFLAVTHFSYFLSLFLT